MLHSLIPGRGERALIVGQTGSGKTAFAVWLLMRIPIAPVIIYDTKEEPKFSNLPASIVVETMEQTLKAYHDEKIDYIIVRPHVELLGHPEELDNYLFYHYINMRNSVAYIDEAYTFHSNGRSFKGLIALLSRGRSRGITTIISSQRPTMLSRLAITESQKLYVFKLGDRQDRKRLSDVIPNFDDYKLPEKHGFYFFESGDDEPHLFQPVKLDAEMDTGYTDIQQSDSDHGREPSNSLGKHTWV